MKRYLKSGMVAGLISFCCGTASPQSLMPIDELWHWEANCDIGFNSDGYQVGLGINYFPMQYVGVKFLFGVCAEIERLGDWENDYWGEREPYAMRLKFMPTLVLRSPRIIYWRQQDAGFYLFAEPGLVLSPGSSGSRHAENFNWDFKCGVNMQIDRFIIYAGYGITDFCLYSGAPYSHWGHSSHEPNLSHAGFIGAAIKF